MRLGISACLLGELCRYDGKSAKDENPLIYAQRVF